MCLLLNKTQLFLRGVLLKFFKFTQHNSSLLKTKSQQQRTAKETQDQLMCTAHVESI